MSRQRKFFMWKKLGTSLDNAFVVAETGTSKCRGDAMAKEIPNNVLERNDAAVRAGNSSRSSHGLELEEVDNRFITEEESPPETNHLKMAKTLYPVGLAAVSKCPYSHGTVSAQPFPGYVHGSAKTGICPEGCRPKMNSELQDKETVMETLLREAKEYQQIYYAERGPSIVPAGENPAAHAAARWNEIRASIASIGTYEQTYDELEHGMRLAWRNAPKCPNRKFWGDIKLRDHRATTTNEGMFDACVEHLNDAMVSGVTEM